MFVQSDPDIPAAFAAALRYSLFVRNIYYSVDLYHNAIPYKVLDFGYFGYN